MKQRISFISFAALVLSAGASPAQTVSTLVLSDSQELGRKLTSQSCVVCHFPLQHSALTYGPRLSRETMMGDEASLRAVISEGSQRMPGFKHMFNDEQIGAVISFIKSLPPPAEAPKKD